MQNIKVHPELVERFQELVRYHFNATRKGKEPQEIKKAMREADLKEQAAFLSGTCEIKVKIEHEASCGSHSMWFDGLCDCASIKTVVFQEIKNDFKTDINKVIRDLYTLPYFDGNIKYDGGDHDENK